MTWKLRTGVKWSDGSAFTADDVVFTWKYLADEPTASANSDYATGIKSVVAKDPNTAVVTYADPNPNYYQFGVGGTGVILQKKQFEPTLGDVRANVARLLELTEEAARRGARLVVLPEMATTGYCWTARGGDSGD